MSRPTKPNLNANPDLTRLRQSVEAYIERCELALDENLDDCLDLEDLSAYVAEAALEAFYGPKVFDDYVNEIES